MVVIEPCSDPAEDRNLSKTKFPEPSEQAKSNEDLFKEEEGFETASEGECETEDGEDPNPSSPKCDPREEDQPTQEQLQQKALDQANDARAEGNRCFGAGQYEDALAQYAIALQIAPEMPSSSEIRSICHANSAACLLKLEKYDDAIKECTKALELNPTYMKALIRKAEAHEKLENFEEAIADLKKILELDSSNVQARRGIQRLEPLAAEKREKMKEEMIGKLKDMGNSLLGRFGMSVDNFKAVKDPNTGSYSISFQR